MTNEMPMSMPTGFARNDDDDDDDDDAAGREDGEEPAALLLVAPRLDGDRPLTPMLKLSENGPKVSSADAADDDDDDVGLVGDTLSTLMADHGGEVLFGLAFSAVAVVVGAMATGCGSSASKRNTGGARSATVGGLTRRACSCVSSSCTVKDVSLVTFRRLHRRSRSSTVISSVGSITIWQSTAVGFPCFIECRRGAVTVTIEKTINLDAFFFGPSPPRLFVGKFLTVTWGNFLDQWFISSNVI